MSSDEARSFDFREPCRLAVSMENRLLGWHTTAAKLVRDKWASYLPFEVTMTPASPETAHPAEKELPGQLFGFCVKFEGHDRITLVGVPAALGLAFVEGILGNTPDAMPEDQPLSSIEASLLEIVVQLLLDAFNESAVSHDLPQCQLGQHEEHPHLIRIFPGDDELVILRMRIQFPFGDQELLWIWPELLAHEMLPEDRLTPPAATNDSHLEQVVQRIPFEVSIRLGSTRLNVTDLANLNVGDVLVLDQRVNDPVEGFIAHQSVLNAWPGQRGNRFGVQIHSVMET